MRGETPSELAIKKTYADFNPLSPCGERLNSVYIGYCFNSDFNPLSPCGERLIENISDANAQNFNPLSPCGERHPALS